MNSRKASFKNAIKQKTEYLRQQWGDGTNAIATILSADKDTKDAATYTIDGRKVNATQQLPKGIYIRNGRKVVVK